MLDIGRVLASRPKKPDATELGELLTPWGEALLAGEGPVGNPATDNPSGEKPLLPQSHPHPQFERSTWESLDGLWEYAVVRPAGASEARVAWKSADAPQVFDGTIRVPFSPEAPLSGVGRRVGPEELLWYRRWFDVPAELAADTAAGAAAAPRDPGAPQAPSAPSHRCLLHFEAVDYACACYVNGIPSGQHVGGYEPFAFDITDALRLSADGRARVELCVWDPNSAGAQPRGKQRLERGGIWYTAQSGIWQTVWLETVPACHVAHLRLNPQVDKKRLVVEAQVAGVPGRGTALVARLYRRGTKVSLATRGVTASGAVRMVLPLRELDLWSPEDPALYDLELTCGADTVRSYCAFRTIEVRPAQDGLPRLYLNGSPLFVRGLLDQGYWPDGLMTAPADEALAFDIQTARDLGFNLLRKHIKVESDRWYWHCDRLGMLVMQDMVCGGGPYSSWHSSYKPTLFMASWGRKEDRSPRALADLGSASRSYRREWTELCRSTVARLGAHPCIVAWCLFNEGWGQFDARAATEMVRELDASRPIDATSGWYDQRCGDFLSVHNYFRSLRVWRDRARPGRAFLLSEFGGLSCSVPGHRCLEDSYGYEQLDDPAAFAAGVRRVLARADALGEKGLAGYVYTQLSDVEGETNGLLTYDRRVNKLAAGRGETGPAGEKPTPPAAGAGAPDAPAAPDPAPDAPELLAGAPEPL